MAGNYKQYKITYMAPALGGAIKTILTLCLGMLILLTIVPDLEKIFVLSFRNFMPWQFLTAAFCHANLMHFAFNMYLLWMFGTRVEEHLGTKQFTWFYLACAIFANVAWFAWGFLAMSPVARAPLGLLGASGAIFGVLYAFGYLFPNDTIYLFFVIPIKAKWAVLGAGILELWMSLTTKGSTIAHGVHLMGLVVAIFFLDVTQNGMMTRWLRSKGLDLSFWYRTRHLTVIPGNKGADIDGSSDGEAGEYLNGDDGDDDRPYVVLKSPFFRDDDDSNKGPIIH